MALKISLISFAILTIVFSPRAFAIQNEGDAIYPTHWMYAFDELDEEISLKFIDAKIGAANTTESEVSARLEKLKYIKSLQEERAQEEEALVEEFKSGRMTAQEYQRVTKNLADRRSSYNLTYLYEIKKVQDKLESAVVFFPEYMIGVQENITQKEPLCPLLVPQTTQNISIISQLPLYTKSDGRAALRFAVESAKNFEIAILNGTSVAAKISNDTPISGVVESLLPLGNLSEGNYSLSILADKHGNVSQLFIKNAVIIDNTPPEIKIPVSGLYLYTSNLLLSGSITDASGIKEANVTVRGKLLPYPEKNYIVTSDESGSFSTEITLNAGENEISVKAVDLAGNVGYANSTMIYVSTSGGGTAGGIPQQTGCPWCCDSKPPDVDCSCNNNVCVKWHYEDSPEEYTCQPTDADYGRCKEG